MGNTEDAKRWKEGRKGKDEEDGRKGRRCEVFSREVSWRRGMMRGKEIDGEVAMDTSSAYNAAGSSKQTGATSLLLQLQPAAWTGTQGQKQKSRKILPND